MRRGCISLGETKCDQCGRMVRNAERYLLTDDEADTGEKGRTKRICLECCLQRGMIETREEKGERIVTFFPENKETPQA